MIDKNVSLVSAAWNSSLSLLQAFQCVNIYIAHKHTHISETHTLHVHNTYVTQDERMGCCVQVTYDNVYLTVEFSDED